MKLTRVALIVTIALAILALPLAAGAQQAGKVRRIGFLGSDPAGASSLIEAFRQGLRDLGWVEGQNIIIEYRWTQGKVDRLPELIADLIRVKVDLIFAPNSTSVEPARRATSTIPIVFAAHADPVGLGHVSSLARPGGNITGLSQLLTELSAKELELLKETVPGVSRVAVLRNPTTPSHTPALKAVEDAARTLGLQLQVLEAGNPDEFKPAFTAMTRNRAGALLVLASPLYFVQRARLVELALKHRLPAMFGARENVEAGGLMSYAPDLRDLFRRSAIYVDKILKGTKPADLPVEQASKYELVINLKTAKALGLTLPQSVLIRADHDIQ